VPLKLAVNLAVRVAGICGDGLHFRPVVAAAASIRSITTWPSFVSPVVTSTSTMIPCVIVLLKAIKRYYDELETRLRQDGPLSFRTNS
jgi:hypothetical protein